MSCNAYQNRKTLLVGEVNSGKTKRTLKILQDLLACEAEAIAVLDLAPEKIQGIGGKMPLSAEERKRVFYLSPLVKAPRVCGKNEEEAWQLARENAQRIEEALQSLWKKNWSTLIINDVSLYLQTKEVEDLMAAIEGIPTLVINGYYGKYFAPGALTRREREQMEKLISLCDQIFYLPPAPPAYYWCSHK